MARAVSDEMRPPDHTDLRIGRRAEVRVFLAPTGDRQAQARERAGIDCSSLTSGTNTSPKNEVLWRRFRMVLVVVAPEASTLLASRRWRNSLS